MKYRDIKTMDQLEEAQKRVQERIASQHIFL